MSRHELPERFQRRLQIHYMFDSNVLIQDVLPAVMELYALRDAGWIEISKADAMDIELTQPESLERSSELPEYFGVMTLDHSRLDHALLGSDDDAELDDEIRKVFFPGVNWERARDNHVRDAMHIHTAVRYGATAFVTFEKRLWKRDPVDSNIPSLNSLRVWHPDTALAWALKRRDAWIRREKLRSVSDESD